MSTNHTAIFGNSSQMSEIATSSIYLIGYCNQASYGKSKK